MVWKICGFFSTFFIKLHTLALRSLWEEEGRLIISQLPGLEEILALNGSSQQVWSVGDHHQIQQEVLLNEKILERSKTHRVYMVNGIYDENGRLTGAAFYMPVFTENQFEGYVIGVFDIKKIMQNVLAKEGLGKYHIAILHGGNEISNLNTVHATNQAGGIDIPLNLQGLNVDISVRALEGALGKREFHLPGLLIGAGIVTALLTSFLTYYGLKAKERAEKWKMALTQLRRANDTIAEQDKLVSLGTLTAGIAHEVKNPLNIMKSFSELSVGLVEEISHILKNYIPGFKEEERESLNEALATLQVNLTRIYEQSKRANNTIQRMLAHSRGNKEPLLTDVHGLLDEYLTLSYYAARAQDATFNIKISKRYDTCAPKVNIVAEDMGRVFLNLFNNAYYTLSQKKKKEGSRFNPELTVTTLYIEGRLEIRIRDNGFGIPPSIRDKIFVPFFTTKPVGMGTGLGLSLSRAIILDNGGTLDFVTKEGEFTEFYIALPGPSVA